MVSKALEIREGKRKPSVLGGGGREGGKEGGVNRDWKHFITFKCKDYECKLRTIAK